VHKNANKTLEDMAKVVVDTEVAEGVEVAIESKIQAIIANN
jgi:hypothetical protein